MAFQSNAQNHLKMAFGSIYAYLTVLAADSNSFNDTVRNEHCFSRIVHQVTIPEFGQAEIFVPCGATRAHEDCNTLQYRAMPMFMTARGLMNILVGMPFHVYIANLISKAFNLQKFIIVSSESSVPSCIIQARYDELPMLQHDTCVIRLRLCSDAF